MNNEIAATNTHPAPELSAGHPPSLRAGLPTSAPHLGVNLSGLKGFLKVHFLKSFNTREYSARFRGDIKNNF